jgi:hypothetical protein
MTRRNPFVPGGPLPLNSDVYIERAVDQHLYDELLQMNYVKIIQPRQQGKTSLITRIQSKLNTYQTHRKVFKLVYITAESLPVDNEKKWYHELGQRIIDQLNYFIPLQNVRPPCDSGSWRTFLAELACSPILGTNLEPQIIIAIDEVGAVPKQFAEQFFRVIRSMYTERNSQPLFTRLSFVLIGSINPAQLISGEHVSPFNVAIDIVLDNFNFAQVKILTDKLPLSKELSITVPQMIHSSTNGQPFLVQFLCHNIAIHKEITIKTVEHEIETIFQKDSTHLKGIINQIKSNHDLIVCLENIYKENIRCNPAVNDLHFALRNIIGIISSDNNGYCQISNPIYERAWLESDIHNDKNRIIER